MMHPFYRLMFLVGGLLLASHAHAQQCGPNVGCDNLSACRPHETYRIPFNTIRQCMDQGIDPPLEWRKQGGAGAINTGGSGNITPGGLNDPFMPDPGTEARNAGGLPFSFGGNGPAANNPPDCSSYKSPRLTNPSDLLGETLPLNSQDPYGCGFAVTLEHDWATSTPNANMAAISLDGSNEIEVYQKSGSNMRFSHRAQMPSFYCELRQRRVNRPSRDGNTIEIEYYAEPIPIVLSQQYAEIGTNTRALAFALRHGPQTIAPGNIEDGFMIVRHEGNGQLRPPEPDPEWFTSRGATRVNSQCYSLERLLSQEIPDEFGSMMFGHRPVDGAASRTVNPHRFMSNNPEQCEAMLQYVDAHNPSFYSPPTATYSKGRIQGGGAYSRATVQSGGGRFVSAATSATPFYNGSVLYVSNNYVYLGTSATNINRQTFPGGVSFTINENRQLRVPPPGRIRLDRSYRMQVIDGATVEDNFGNIVNNVAPNAYVQFPSNKVVEGFVDSSIVVPSGTSFPTNSNNEMRLPYDLRLNQLCEAQ